MDAEQQRRFREAVDRKAEAAKEASEHPAQAAARGPRALAARPGLLRRS